MHNLTAEILAIGDEMIGGGRLDTNTQYLAQQLSEIGVQVLFHTTVGDNSARQAEVFRMAAQRVDVVVATGGLGPTADDLTRQVLAEIMQVALVRHEETVAHIRGLFKRHGRAMPESNLVQALFPAGSRVIPNSEGTAPGIDVILTSADKPCRFFCLPGVPAEMREMWWADVRPKICQMSGRSLVFLTHVINCFGSGESHIEALLGDLISRGHDPLVGITASQAVISLRIVAQADSREGCLKKIAPVDAFIRGRLGDLVFGSGDETLEDVVVRQLNLNHQTIAVVDFGFNGDIAAALSRAQAAAERRPLLGGSYFSPPAELLSPSAAGGLSLTAIFSQHAAEIREQMQTTWGVAVSWPYRKPQEDREYFAVAVTNGDVSQFQEFPHAGHSALRHTRSVKQALNYLRLILLPS